MKSGIRAILQNILEMDEEGIKGPRDKKQMDEKGSKTSFLHKGNCGLFVSKYSF